MLIIFDAARYDIFGEVYPDYFVGELSKVYNGGATWTLPWLIQHCQGKLDCTLYSAMPTLSGGAGYLEKWFTLLKTYEPHKHFRRIISWKNIVFDYAMSTAFPEMVNRAVLKEPDEKMVVHYMQPHIPYVGNPPMPWTKGGGMAEKTKDKLARSEITIDKLKLAYKGNMRLAFAGAVELAGKLDGRIYITSDHGEALGEGGYFYHGRGYPRMDCLCHVPWFEVER